MRFTTTIALAFSAMASLAAAAEGDCAAQNILDACLAGYKTRIENSEKTNDYIGLCDVYRDVLVCYNNCPKSNERAPVEGQVNSFCAAAQPLRASLSASVASAASVAATQSHTSETSTATDSSSSRSRTSSGSRTASGSSSSSSPTAPSFQAGAASLGAPASAALVVLLGAAGLL
ncbi:uncharacterized protein K460DRAFT_360871 [Cucurbitaria berberidis CBS 394.84]|uniref:GPI anchored serine-threonine rich protein n=1 Tax=Cucurbitaria berberidis CBS 394.84 TaxID=1168544 RepID=A0A9P4GQT6_9PLEO|nr:uncharacterized protein K460DRAFT_360871 [Cucurbitaria berberidis CBS 394.84]KAF1850005.1 hypothetical protein K460DRAFT_360871 [Cucurbitaria berberidis CBS 394.84]